MVWEFKKPAFHGAILEESKKTFGVWNEFPFREILGFSLKRCQTSPIIPFVGKEADAERKEAYKETNHPTRLGVWACTKY